MLYTFHSTKHYLPVSTTGKVCVSLKLKLVRAKWMCCVAAIRGLIKGEISKVVPTLSMTFLQADTGRNNTALCRTYKQFGFGLGGMESANHLQKFRQDIFAECGVSEDEDLE